MSVHGPQEPAQGSPENLTEEEVKIKKTLIQNLMIMKEALFTEFTFQDSLRRGYFTYKSSLENRLGREGKRILREIEDAQKQAEKMYEALGAMNLKEENLSNLEAKTLKEIKEKHDEVLEKFVTAFEPYKYNEYIESMIPPQVNNKLNENLIGDAKNAENAERARRTALSSVTRRTLSEEDKLKLILTLPGALQSSSLKKAFDEGGEGSEKYTRETLESILIMPVQRIPRHLLFFDQIKKNLELIKAPIMSSFSAARQNIAEKSYLVNSKVGLEEEKLNFDERYKSMKGFIGKTRQRFRKALSSRMESARKDLHDHIRDKVAFHMHNINVNIKEPESNKEIKENQAFLSELSRLQKRVKDEPNYNEKTSVMMPLLKKYQKEFINKDIEMRIAEIDKKPSLAQRDYTKVFSRIAELEREIKSSPNYEKENEKMLETLKRHYESLYEKQLTFAKALQNAENIERKKSKLPGAKLAEAGKIPKKPLPSPSPEPAISRLSGEALTLVRYSNIFSKLTPKDQEDFIDQIKKAAGFNVSEVRKEMIEFYSSKTLPNFLRQNPTYDVKRDPIYIYRESLKAKYDESIKVKHETMASQKLSDKFEKVFKAKEFPVETELKMETPQMEEKRKQLTKERQQRWVSSFEPLDEEKSQPASPEKNPGLKK